MTPENIFQLAKHGITLDISSNVSLKPETLKTLVEMTVKNHGHIIINAGIYKSESLQSFATIGGKHLTIKF